MKIIRIHSAKLYDWHSYWHCLLVAFVFCAFVLAVFSALYIPKSLWHSIPVMPASYLRPVAWSWIWTLSYSCHVPLRSGINLGYAVLQMRTFTNRGRFFGRKLATEETSSQTYTNFLNVQETHSAHLFYVRDRHFSRSRHFGNRVSAHYSDYSLYLICLPHLIQLNTRYYLLDSTLAWLEWLETGSCPIQLTALSSSTFLIWVQCCHRLLMRYAAWKCVRPFFVAYISPVACTANAFGVFPSQYADDTLLCVALSKKVVNDLVTNLQNCLFDVHTWLSQNGKTPDKSEAVLLSTTRPARASFSPLTDVSVAGWVVPLTDTVTLLGVTTDRHLTFD